MSTFIRRYSRYLNEKSFAYRQMSFDFVRVKKGYGVWDGSRCLCCAVVDLVVCCFTRRQKVTLALKNTKKSPKMESHLGSPVRLQTEVQAARRCVGGDPSETSCPLCLCLCQS